MTHDLITEIPRLSVTIYKHVIPTYYTPVTPVECAYSTQHVLIQNTLDTS